MKGLYCLAFVIASGSALAEELIYEYKAPLSDGLNTFVGINSGNKTMSPQGGPSSHASRNTAVGRNSFAKNQTGWENTAVGANALWANETGFHNTAVGYVALASSVEGYNNTAVGHASMYRNLSGIHNTALGQQSLYSNTTGSHNVAIGKDALFSNDVGYWNTAVGVDALWGITTGWGNTGVGGAAGYSDNHEHRNVTGSMNTWVGYQAGPGSSEQHDGVIGIGYGARTTKSWQAVFGSPAIVETLLYGNVGINAVDPAATLVVMGDAVNLTGVWDVYSDERLKQDIQPYEDGLDAVLALRPVRFRYNGVEGLPSDTTQVGLIAQEVEQVAPYMISTKDGHELSDVRTMSTQALPYMLINAVQELQTQIADVRQRIASLEAGDVSTADSSGTSAIDYEIAPR